MSRTMKKAMRLLDLFSLQRPEWGVSEVAKALGFPKIDDQRADVRPGGPEVAEPVHEGEVPAGVASVRA
jgi:hypothetical protein